MNKHYFAQEKRPIFGSNEGFLKLLEIFEKLFFENNCDFEKIMFRDVKWEPTQEMLDEFLYIYYYLFPLIIQIITSINKKD